LIEHLFLVVFTHVCLLLVSPRLLIWPVILPLKRINLPLGVNKLDACLDLLHECIHSPMLAIPVYKMLPLACPSQVAR